MSIVSFLATPQETVYFGPTSSLPAGEAHHGESLFPPPLSAWQGMIRTRLLVGSGVDLRDRSRQGKLAIEALVGTPDALPRGWEIEAPVPVRLLEHGSVAEGWFPSPLWLHRSADAPADEPPRALRLNPMDASATVRLLSDLSDAKHPDLTPVGAPKAGRTDPYGGWMSAEDLLKVLHGGHPTPLSREEWRERRKQWDLPPFVSRENRPGLVVDDANATAKAGMLYFLEALRFHRDTGLAGSLSADLRLPLQGSTLEEGAVYVGRKARPMLLSALPPRDPSWQAIMQGSFLPTEPPDGFQFWLYLVSAAGLSNTPSDTFSNPVRPPLPPVGDTRFEVRAALLHKPSWQGGFSLATGQAKPSRPVVRPGSAWLVSVTGGTPRGRGEALRALHNRSPFVSPFQAAFGEGRTWVGLLEPAAGGRP